MRLLTLLPLALVFGAYPALSMSLSASSLGSGSPSDMMPLTQRTLISHDTDSPRLTAHQQRESRCIAHAAWREAKGEGYEGMRAVTWVVVNRARITGQTACSIIAEPGQFSPFQTTQWRRIGQSQHLMPPALPQARDASAEVAKTLAEQAVTGRLRQDPTKGSTHFHARRVRPGWAKSTYLQARIGSHLFYRVPTYIEVAQAP